MGFWSSFGSSMADSAGSGLMSNIGMVDYFINPLARAGYDEFREDERENSLLNKRASNDLDLAYYPKMVDAVAASLPKLKIAERQALEAAGYNPLLAVQGASGASVPASFQGMPVSSADTPRSTVRASAILDNLQREAAIRQTNAQTEFVKRRTLGEGWTIKTLSRSEAMGLGANMLHLLGINLNASHQDTFLVAYNPITNEWRNLGNTHDGLGTTGEANDAATVRVLEEKGSPVKYYYKGESERPYKATALDNLHL